MTESEAWDNYRDMIFEANEEKEAESKSEPKASDKPLNPVTGEEQAEDFYFKRLAQIDFAYIKGPTIKDPLLRLRLLMQLDFVFEPCMKYFDKCESAAFCRILAGVNKDGFVDKWHYKGRNTLFNTNYFYTLDSTPKGFFNPRTGKVEEFISFKFESFYLFKDDLDNFCKAFPQVELTIIFGDRLNKRAWSVKIQDGKWFFDKEESQKVYEHCYRRKDKIQYMKGSKNRESMLGKIHWSLYQRFVYSLRETNLGTYLHNCKPFFVGADENKSYFTLKEARFLIYIWKQVLEWEELRKRSADKS